MDADQILREALHLPADDRARLAGELLQSLDEPGRDLGRDAAWEEEIRRRLDDHDAGKTAALPIERLFDALHSSRDRRP